MSDSPLHVVFGTGQVGVALAARLSDLGVDVRTGPALIATTGVAAGVLLLATATAGFHDLAGSQAVGSSGPARF